MTLPLIPLATSVSTRRPPLLTVWLLAHPGARAEGDLVVHAVVAGEGAAPVIGVAVGLWALRLEQPPVPARPACCRRREPPAAAVLIRAERQAHALAAHHRAAAIPRRHLARAHPVDVRWARRPLDRPPAPAAGSMSTGRLKPSTLRTS